MHRLLGQESSAPVVETIAYSLIGTTIIGTLVYLTLENFMTEAPRRNKKRDVFVQRRQTRRRNPIRLGK
jgi:hypothetical protein